MLKFILTDKGAGLLLLATELAMIGVWMLTQQSIFQFVAGVCVGLLFARTHTHRAATPQSDASPKGEVR